MGINVSIIVLVLALGIFIVLAYFYIARFITLAKNKGVPTIGIFPSHKQLMKEKLHLPKNIKLIDIGCGTGGALRFFSNTYGCAKLDGVDLNDIAIRVGNFRNKRKGYARISLKKQNIFTTDISGYDYVYAFLMPNLMGDIEKRLETALQPNTILICLAFSLPTWEPFETIYDKDETPKIFMYKKK